MFKLTKSEIYYSYLVKFLANEVAKKYNEKYELNVLYDLDLLKFIIYYYFKMGLKQNITEEEKSLISQTNKNKDSINLFYFSDISYDTTNMLIDFQAKINEFINKNES
jgi:hypothetical protein